MFWHRGGEGPGARGGSAALAGLPVGRAAVMAAYAMPSSLNAAFAVLLFGLEAVRGL